MSSPPNPKNPNSLYPQVIQTNPDNNSPFLSTPPSLYPSIHSSLVENLFPDSSNPNPHPSAPPVDDSSSEETILEIPGAMAHLIDKQSSVQLACNDFSILRLRQGGNVIAMLARIGDIQWPLTKDEASVKLDDSHYFFALRVPKPERSDSSSDDDDQENLLNYGLTFASKGQDGLLKDLDVILENCSSFSVQKVSKTSEVLDGSMAKQVAPSEISEAGDMKEMMEERSAVYWTTLAPNVEEYSGCVARAIVLGSGQLIRGILWCGDVTVDRLKWGNEMLMKRLEPNAKPAEISEEARKRIQRVKLVSKMSEKVAIGILSGVIKVSGFFTSSVANSRMGKRFLGLLPGEVVLASLDGFGKVCDAVEVAGKSVLSTSSVVTTGLVSHRYGEQAAELTNESFDAAGHALGTAWAVFKIRKAFDVKSAIKTKSLAKSAAKAAAAEMKAKTDK